MDLRSLPFLIAQEKGMLKEQGVNIKGVESYSTSLQLMDVFSKEKIDAAFVGSVVALSAVSSGSVKAKMVAQVSRGGVGLIVRNKELRTPFELAELSVAVPGNRTIENVWLNNFFVRYQLDGRVYVHTFPPGRMPQALTELRLVEGFAAFEPLPSKIAEGENAGEIDFPNAKWTGYPSGCLMVSESFLHNQPELTEKLVRAHVGATLWINGHSKEAALAVAKLFLISESAATKALANIDFVTKPDREGLAELAERLKRLGLASEENSSKLIERFIENKFSR